MATATLSAGLQTIPLDQITENPFNPRKHFEKAPLQELAESIKVHGVRQPVLVRPMPGKDKGFQLVVGARRLRASKLAGRTDIPAIVDPELDDRSALEIMVIENLQREDVHPLDEALGYQVLMEQRCYECNADPGFHKRDCPKVGTPVEEITVEQIAAKVGKSVGYVYARMKLLALVPAAREAFQKEHISAGHGVLIARLQPRDQVLALRACFEDHTTSFDRDRLKKLDPIAAKLLDIVYFADEDTPPRLLPEKGLREWIQDNINLRLKDVPWDLNDAKLYPEAGACATCEKRSASNPALFAELAVKGEDTCFDAACYGKKREAFVKLTIREDKKRVEELSGPTSFNEGEKQVDRIRQISEQTAYTKPTPDQRVLKQGQWLPAKKKGECPNVEEALIVNGENAGVKKLVCCDGHCKVHKHHLSAERSMTGSSSKPDPKAEAEREFKRKVEDQLIVEILKAAAGRLKPDASTMLALGNLASKAYYFDNQRTLEVLGLKSEKELEALEKKADVNQAMSLLLLAIVGDNDWIDAPVMKLASSLGKVDVPKLRKELEKKLAPVQTPAKPEPPKKAKTAKKAKGKKGK